MRDDEKILYQFAELRNLLEEEQKKLGRRNEDLNSEIKRFIAQISLLEEKMAALTSQTKEMIQKESEGVFKKLDEKASDNLDLLVERTKRSIERALNEKMAALNKDAFEAHHFIKDMKAEVSLQKYFLAAVFALGCIGTSSALYYFFPKKEYRIYAVTPEDIAGMYKKNIYHDVKDALSPEAKKEFEQKLQEFVWGEEKQ